MPVKNPRWPPRNLVFFTFEHQTAVISRASSWSPCLFLFYFILFIFLFIYLFIYLLLLFFIYYYVWASTNKSELACTDSQGKRAIFWAVASVRNINLEFLITCIVDGMSLMVVSQLNLSWVKLNRLGAYLVSIPRLRLTR